MAQNQSSTNVTGIKESQKEFEKMAKKVVEKLRSLTNHYGALVQADVASRARGLFDTTDYDQTIQLRMSGKPTNPRALISSDAPQAHRLEYGFSGVDSLGRSYHQAPRPHFRPALVKFEGRYRQSVEALFH